MLDARQIALSGYYFGTMPWRARIRRRLASQGQMPLGVLFYHRVADQHPNDWTLSNAQFEKQMRWLQRHAEIVTLEELQDRMTRGRNDRLAVAITFDDGYAENCDRAVPYLLDQGIPFTYFVALDFVVQQRPFPHDQDLGIPLPVNTPEQLREMAAAGVEIGAHTRTHCDVGAIDDVESMLDEITTAKNELSALVKKPIRYFAFPYGQVANLSAAAAEWMKQDGILGVCSAYGAYNFPDADAFHIQRYHGDPEFIRFKNWVSIDPRKMSVGRQFELPESKILTGELMSHWPQETTFAPVSTDRDAIEPSTVLR